MRLSLKVLAIFWVGLLLLIGALLFNAYSRFKPEAFIALLTEQVQKNYPGAKLNVGKIKYRFSLDFNLNLQAVHLRRSGKLLASIGEAELKVPWWLLLFNNGNAQINLNDLDIFVDHSDIPDGLSKADKGSSPNIKVELPTYMADAQYTLRAKNVSIRDINSTRRYFVVSKLLVREFQYGKNSAFELNIPVSIKNGDTQYMSDLWLFGDVTPETTQWIMNFRGEFRTRENSDKFKIEDLLFSGKAMFAPQTLAVSSELNLLIDKKEVGKGNFQADQEGMSVAFQLSQFPMEYFQFAYEEVKNQYLPILSGEGSGEIKFIKKFGQLSADASAKISFPGNFTLNPKDFIAGNWKIGFQDARWEVSFISPKGEASFFRRSFMDTKKNKVTQYNEELGFSGLDLSVVLSPVTTFHSLYHQVSEQFYSSTVSFSNCLLNDQTLDGTFRYGITPEQKYYQGELANEKTSFKINFSNKNQNSLDVKLNKFNWDPSIKILEPFYVADPNIVNGTVEGRWSDSWVTGQWLVQLDVQNPGNGKLAELISQTAAFFEVDAKPFPHQTLNVAGKGGVFTLNSLLLDGDRPAKFTGSLSTKQKSHITLSYPKNKKFKPVKKEIIEPYWIPKEEI